MFAYRRWFYAEKTQKLAVHAVGCAHDSGEKRNFLIVSICLLIGVGFTLRSNTHRAVKVLDKAVRGVCVYYCRT
jgi:hypothetical protein